MPNPLQALNENFFYNSMLARALVQLLPTNVRALMRFWLDKLHQMDETPEEMAVRNDYMWFMLLVLQNKKITKPFNEVPPHGDLQPLKEILPLEVYEEILTSSDQNMSWLDKVGDAEEEKPSEPVRVPPCEFFESQPLPHDGVICYIAAFSDYDD